MKDILEDIIACKRKEVREQKEAISISHLEEEAYAKTSNYSMKNSLANSPTGIIAEFKRKSPSKGWIKEKAAISEIPLSYEKAGAAALSILTDTPFFGGNLKDLKDARSLVNLPLLRKDFIVDEYQLYQAKALGANAVLLIAAALTVKECKELAEKAHELNMELLLEIHREEELDYINDHIDMVGVNNRNLGTFHTDIENSFRLAPLLPSDKILVSESGISSPETIARLREAGFRGFLIGENFMRTENPGEALKSFIEEISGQ